MIVSMWLISVIPITRGLPKERLYYFSKEKIETGDLIEVPVRSRVIMAKVEEIKSVAEAKTELKNLPFAVRKISTLRLPDFFSEPFMRAVEKSAKFMASSLGPVLYSVLPPKRLLTALSGKPGKEKFENFPEKMTPTNSFVIQCPDEERFGEYRMLIREEFAKKKSVFILAPTISEAIRLHREIEKGITSYSFLFHQRLARNKTEEGWKKALAETHPILVVGTPQFLGLPRKDFGTLVIERESSRSYKKETRPFTDHRIFASFLARQLGAKIVLGDSMIRTETYHWLESGHYSEYGKISLRQPSPSTMETIEFGREKFWQERPVLSPELEKIALENKLLGQRLLLFSPRRGLSPRTICRDCGKSIICPNCQGSMVLHEKNKMDKTERIYLCHRCGYKMGTEIRCPSCSSWNLLPIGVGSQKIQQEINRSASDLKVFRADRDTVKSDAEAEKLAEKFLKTPGGIMVGTELILPHLGQKIENVAIIFPELLNSAPEYSADEDAVRTVLRIRSLASLRFFVQTTDRQLPIVKISETPNLQDFYRKEIAVRKTLDYPPFSILILFCWSESDSESIRKDIENVAKGKNITFLEKSVFNLKENRAVLKINAGEWPDEKLREKILSLPTKISAEVMPNRLFN